MFAVLLLLFTLLPFVELALLFRLGAAIGGVETLALVVATGVVGAALARWQGLQVMARLHRELNQGQLPTGALWDGALILVAGCLLVTPGVITDAVGFSLLLPPVRRGVAALVRRWATKRFQVTHLQGGAPFGGEFGHRSSDRPEPGGGSPFGDGPFGSPAGRETDGRETRDVEAVVRDVDPER